MITHPVSPNTVLANALTSAEDLLRPHIVNAEPERIVFTVGTQINGAPHIGTSLVQALTFATAARIRDRFGVPAVVQFGALDNAPYAIVTDKASGHRYQRAYAHALGAAGIAEQIDTLYRPLFTALSERLKVPFSVETYTQQQAAQRFRRTWLRVLPRMDAARWYLSPSSGILVDGALQAVGLTRGQLPARLFCPQVVADTGAKLSKSLIREGRAPLPDGAAPWMLDTREWPGSLADYVDCLLGVTDVLLADPRHFYRSYSAGELGRLISTTTN
ncbi:hypothetical protein ACIHAA_27815 [Streptomyces sp. NPDC052040]|uniref:hypothetical protein n=1 Tax=Streptomyces sp. NPDC052040 TaxID=3365682 RepID=UPI0037D90274